MSSRRRCNLISGSPLLCMMAVMVGMAVMVSRLLVVMSFSKVVGSRKGRVWCVMVRG